MQPAHRWSLALLWSVCAASAQTPVAPTTTTPADSSPVVLHFRCAADGKRVPRFANKGLAPELARAIRFEQRNLVWNIDEARVESPVALATALRQAAKSPTSLRDSADHPGRKELVPLRIAPGAGSLWCDVLQAMDAATAAGFRDLRLVDVPTPWTIPKSVSEPIVGDGELVVPFAVFHEPDDNPDPRRPVFDVHQDGRIVHDGATVHAPGPDRTEDLARLRTRLRLLRAELIAAGRTEKRPDVEGEWLDVTLLVRADLWAAWPDVRRLLVLATDPSIGFWKLELAVADQDEGELLRQLGREGPPRDKR